VCGAVTEQRLPPVLSVDTERKKLTQQLNKMKREFDDFKERSTPLWEEEMKRRDSRFCFFVFFTTRRYASAVYAVACVCPSVCLKSDFY